MSQNCCGYLRRILTGDIAVKLFLGANPLTKAPGALFNLEYLTVLSLRNTQITELPPALGNLRNLETLNLSLNRLRYLPGELLDLLAYPSKLKGLMIHPNPFLRPDIDLSGWDSRTKFEASSENNILVNKTVFLPSNLNHNIWLDRRDGSTIDMYQPGVPQWNAILIARSPIQYMDSRGVVLSKFRLPKSQSGFSDTAAGHNAQTTIETEDLASPPSLPPFARTRTAISSTSTGGRVHSLMELALQTCSRTTQLPVLSSYLPDDAPLELREVLDRIVSQSDDNGGSGHLPCSRCRRRVIVPVAQWLEWWSVKLHDGKLLPGSLAAHPQMSFPHGSTAREDTEEQIVPFVKRACSLACLPQAMPFAVGLPGTLRWSVEESSPRDTEM
jgi:hypothetical protein